MEDGGWKMEDSTTSIHRNFLLSFPASIFYLLSSIFEYLRVSSSVNEV